MLNLVQESWKEESIEKQKMKTGECDCWGHIHTFMCCSVTATAQLTGHLPATLHLALGSSIPPECLLVSCFVFV